MEINEDDDLSVSSFELTFFVSLQVRMTNHTLSQFWLYQMKSSGQKKAKMP
jgi:hypothetical protein